MKRPPRRRDEALFGPTQIGLALLQGLGVLAGVLGLYVWGLAHVSEAEARGLAFLALVTGNLVLALADASTSGARLFAPHRRIYWAIAGISGGALALILFVPPLAAVFRVAPPSPALLALALATGLAGGGWFGVLRALGGRGRRAAAAAGAGQLPVKV